MNIQTKLGYVKESGSVISWPLLDDTIIKELNLSSSLDEVGDEYLISQSYFPLYGLSPSSHSEEETFDTTEIEKSGSVYYLNYTLRNKTEDELILHYEHGWQDIRTKRTKLLEESDYMANSDFSMSLEWKTYRQDLRDITEQSNPFEITWPTKPQ